MGVRLWLICVFISVLVPLTICARTKNDILEQEMTPADSGDVIMKEDAEEVFYNVDLEKYDGVECPKPVPPEHGALVGSGTKVGSVIYVQCEEGYHLQGPTVMACMPVEGGARWDPIVHRQCLDEESHFDESLPLPADLPIGSVEEEPSPQNPEDGPPFLDPRANSDWKYKTQDKGFFNREFSENEVPESSRFESPKDPLPLCLEPPVTGPCKAYFQRYYFDKSTMECRKFIYGGCQGNENNFQTMEECDKTCGVSEE